MSLTCHHPESWSAVWHPADLPTLKVRRRPHRPAGALARSPAARVPRDPIRPLDLIRGLPLPPTTSRPRRGWRVFAMSPPWWPNVARPCCTRPGALGACGPLRPAGHRAAPAAGSAEGPGGSPVRAGPMPLARAGPSRCQPRPGRRPLPNRAARPIPLAVRPRPIPVGAGDHGCVPRCPHRYRA